MPPTMATQARNVSALGTFIFPRKGVRPLCAGGVVQPECRRTQGYCRRGPATRAAFFCSGLFIEPRNIPYSAGADGIPNLPVFMLGAANDADKQLLGKSLPAQLLARPLLFVRGSPVRPMVASSATSLDLTARIHHQWQHFSQSAWQYRSRDQWRSATRHGFRALSRRDQGPEHSRVSHHS